MPGVNKFRARVYVTSLVLPENSDKRLYRVSRVSARGFQCAFGRRTEAIGVLVAVAGASSTYAERIETLH